MLLVDYREGSHDLIKPLQKMGLEVEEMDLEFGDIAFTGRGEGGKPVQVGVEFKQMRECVASLRSERLQGHQLPGMMGLGGMYDFGWLLVEGEVLFDHASGKLLRRKGRRQTVPLAGQMGVSEYFKRLIVMHLCGGLNPWFTQSRHETLRWIEAIYRVWTDTDLDKHRSHIAAYQAKPAMPISAFRMAVCAWPTIGLRTSKAVEDAFQGSIYNAARASVGEWASINILDDTGKARKLGMKDATKIVAFLEGI